jgi:hypothetical protein
MEITGISIDNYLGARRIRLVPLRPVVAIAGPNGAGKSSINEAVRLALGGEILRVDHKRDYKLLISDGAKEAEVRVDTDAGSALYALPKGGQELRGDLATADLSALPFVLNAQGFAKMNAAARRMFLFALTNSTASPKEVARRLKEKGHAEAKIDLVLPMLKSGFPAAEALAKEKASESRGAWKALTGETYGSVKAETWAAVAPTIDEEALHALKMEHATAQCALRDTEQALGAAKAAAQATETLARQLAADTRLAASLPVAQENLRQAQADLDGQEARRAQLEPLAGDGPRQGLIHDMARFINALAAGVVLDADNADRAEALIASYEGEFGAVDAHGDPQAKAELKSVESTIAHLKSSMENLRQRIVAAELAQSRIDNPEVAPAAVDVAALTAKRDDMKLALDNLTVRLVEREREEDLAKNADAITAQAKAHHDTAMAWDAIAAALSPEGIPAEILAQALKPINQALQAAAVATRWKQVRIDPDMSIRADGRPYSLLCESEQWRCDAMIAESIAEISGIKILLLDRMDVLDLPSRAQLLLWLNDRASAGHINTAIVCATMKAKPTGLPDGIEAHWLADGVIERIEEEETV